MNTLRLYFLVPAQVLGRQGKRGVLGVSHTYDVARSHSSGFTFPGSSQFPNAVVLTHQSDYGKGVSDARVFIL